MGSLLSEHVMMCSCCPLLIIGPIYQYTPYRQDSSTLQCRTNCSPGQSWTGQMFVTACCTVSCALGVRLLGEVESDLAPPLGFWFCSEDSLTWPGNLFFLSEHCSWTQNTGLYNFNCWTSNKSISENFRSNLDGFWAKETTRPSSVIQHSWDLMWGYHIVTHHSHSSPSANHLFVLFSTLFTLSGNNFFPFQGLDVCFYSQLNFELVCVTQCWVSIQQIHMLDRWVVSTT